MLAKKLSNKLILCMVSILIISMFVTFVPVNGDSYTLTVSTDASHYLPGGLVTISGVLTDVTTHSSAANCYVTVKVNDPSSVNIYTTIATTNSEGAYSVSFSSILGASQPIGTYSVAATASTNGVAVATASSTYTVSSVGIFPVITVSPNSGPIGASVTITGSGFSTSSTISIYFSGIAQTTSPSTVTSSSNGTFICMLTTPAYSTGVHVIQAKDHSSSATATFTLTSPTATLTPASGTVGSTVAVSGSGFVPSSIVTLKLDGTTLATNPATVTSSSSGSISCTFNIPNTISGAHTVLISDNSGNSVTVTYTVTTFTPTPTPTASPTATPTPTPTIAPTTKPTFTPTPSPSPPPSGWSASLTSSQYSYSDTCTFGVRSDATYSFNNAYDQVKSPSPPQGVYSYFNYPANPTSPVNLQKLGTSIVGPWPADNANWTYQVKAVGTDGPMTISWSSIYNIPSTHVVSLLNSTNGATLANMRQSNIYTFQATADITYTFTIQVATNVQFTLTLSAGWNMVSFPMIPVDASFSSIFSNVGYYQVLSWNGNGYVTPTTAEAGKGYWVLVLNSVSLTITGQPVSSYQLNVQPGWSVIGSINGKTVNAYYLFSGSFYQLLTWNGSQYITATTIEPGKSYWLLVTTSTNVTVS